MGDASYALYLTHPFVLAPIRHSSPIIRVAPPLVVGTFFLLLSIAVAIAVYLAFDQPVSRLLKKALISRSRGPEILLQAPK
jgi:exopolysaccharide production protein ExoZ